MDTHAISKYVWDATPYIVGNAIAIFFKVVYGLAFVMGFWAVITGRSGGPQKVKKMTDDPDFDRALYELVMKHRRK